MQEANQQPFSVLTQKTKGNPFQFVKSMYRGGLFTVLLQLASSCYERLERQEHEHMPAA